MQKAFSRDWSAITHINIWKNISGVSNALDVKKRRDLKHLKPKWIFIISLAGIFPKQLSFCLSPDEHLWEHLKCSKTDICYDNDFLNFFKKSFMLKIHPFLEENQVCSFGKKTASLFLFIPVLIDVKWLNYKKPKTLCKISFVKNLNDRI